MGNIIHNCSESLGGLLQRIAITAIFLYFWFIMRNRKCQLFILLLLLFAQCTPKKHNFAEEIPDPMKTGGYVSNPDNIISYDATVKLNGLLSEMDHSGKAQIAVVLLNSIGDQVIEEVAHEIFNTWKPGDKEKNNGLVVLLVKDQHKIRFETGYGLEGDLPDVICFRIQQNAMVPSFKVDDYDTGIMRGLIAVTEVIRHPEQGNQIAEQSGAIQTDNYEPNEVMDTAIMALAGDVAATADTDSTSEVAYAEAGTDTDVVSEGTVVEDYTQPSLEQEYYEKPGIERPGVGTFFFYFFYMIFSAILFHLLNPKQDGKVDVLYKASFWSKIFVFVTPLVLVLVLSFGLNIPYSGWMIVGLCYGCWTLYLGGRFLMTNVREKQLPVTDRHTRYETLNLAHKNLIFFAFVFPLPLLIYYRWHHVRMKKLRYEPYNCDGCGRPAHLLTRNNKKQFLNDIQAAEEKAGSVTYDVWHCKYCDSAKAVGYDNIYSNVQKCPKCANKTLKKGRKQTIRRATEYHGGEGIQFYECSYCNFVKKERYTTARLSSSSSSSSGGSSSSSSSGGSWGGGSSGGGGSTSSW